MSWFTKNDAEKLEQYCKIVCDILKENHLEFSDIKMMNKISKTGLNKLSEKQLADVVEFVRKNKEKSD